MRYRQFQIRFVILVAFIVALSAPAASNEKLAIGKVAPEIEGKDVDGNKFKLSDYRGKVVVMDFWGDW